MGHQQPQCGNYHTLADSLVGNYRLSRQHQYHEQYERWIAIIAENLK